MFGRSEVCVLQNGKLYIYHGGRRRITLDRCLDTDDYNPRTTYNVTHQRRKSKSIYDCKVSQCIHVYLRSPDETLMNCNSDMMTPPPYNVSDHLWCTSCVPYDTVFFQMRFCGMSRQSAESGSPACCHLPGKLSFISVLPPYCGDIMLKKNK